MDNQYKRSVLITSIGCNTAISVAKSLRLSKSKQHRLVGVDMLPAYDVPGSIFCDAFHKIPAFTNETYLDRVLAIAKAERVEFLISVMDKEIEILSKNEDLFQKSSVTLCLPRHETVQLCNDKYKTITYLQEKGVPTVPIFSRDDLNGGSSQLHYPVFIKPRFGFSSTDSYKITNEDELAVFLKRVPNPVIEEFIEGDHYTIDVLNDLDGKNLVSVPRKEFSAKAGIAVKALVVDDSDLVNFGKKISELIGLCGAANIEVFRRDGDLLLGEINSRFSAGTILSTVAGVNIPELLLEVFSKEPISSNRLIWSPGYHMARYWQEVFSYNKKILNDKFIDYA